MGAARSHSVWSMPGTLMANGTSGQVASTRSAPSGRRDRLSARAWPVDRPLHQRGEPRLVTVSLRLDLDRLHPQRHDVLAVGDPFAHPERRVEGEVGEGAAEDGTWRDRRGWGRAGAAQGGSTP